MKFIEWLSEQVSIALWLMGVLALFISIVEAYKNWETIKEIFSKIKGTLFRFLNSIKTYKRRKYNKTVSTSEYLIWQKEILQIIYPFTNKYKDNDKNAIWKTANAFGYKYEALYFKSKEIKYPFDEVHYKQNLGNFPLKIKEKSGKKKVIYGKQNKISKRYYRLLKPNIGFPDNIGYMLDKIEISENGFSFYAHPNTYLSNVYTSNVLEYELYLLYKRIYKKVSKKNKPETKIEKIDGNKKSFYKKGIHYLKKGKLLLGTDAKEFLLSLLPIRKNIHDKFDNEENILTEGTGRESLLGVQAMVLCKNHRKGYDVLRIRRSERVDAKAGFLQFVPSGGFSALSNDISHDNITSSFSISKAILREFLEECFGEEDFSGRKTISTENIYADPIIKKLNLLKNTQNIEFIGSAFSLVSLRHELCFIIKIDDLDIIDKIHNNEECDHVIDFISLDKIEDIATWKYEFATNPYYDFEKLNPTSAALWNLAKETKLYKECKESKY